MKRRILLIAAAAAVVAPLAALGLLHRRERPSAVAGLFGGEPALEVVAHPDRVDAYRIGDLPAGRNESEASVSDYPVIAGPIAVPPAIREPVSAALLSPSTYGWDYSKGCAPRYGVRLAFSRGVDRVDVLFCFECNVLLIFRDGRTTGGEDCEEGRATFVRAVKAIFPDDGTIQGLREDRSGQASNEALPRVRFADR